jgi:hypothetical protein
LFWTTTTDLWRIAGNLKKNKKKTLFCFEQQMFLRFDFKQHEYK